MKLEIDYDRCSGHGRCYTLLPDVFTDDDRGFGVVIQEELPDDRLEEARKAVQICPERAVVLHLS